MSDKKTVVIIGAGPAGLTAAYELLMRSEEFHPVIFELDDIVGGIARTVNYKGNRMDMGGHRFFSKSDRVLKWWDRILPLQRAAQGDEIQIQYQNKTRSLEVGGNAPDPETEDRVMLVRPRLSRVFFLYKFFDYPVTLSIKTISNMGLWRTARIGTSYLWRKLFPVAPEVTLEDFYINHFGHYLYSTFFKPYSQKVWGVPATEISAEWGAQRIKGLSITKSVQHALEKLFKGAKSVAQKQTETSLIEQFLYPKYGPGQMWEEVTKIILAKGGELHFKHEVVGIHTESGVVVGVDVRDLITGEVRFVQADFVLSSMPVKELISVMSPKPPAPVRTVAEGLQYRDFIIVGLLARRLAVQNDTKIQTREGMLPDSWIYMQEDIVKMGRIEIFNNWSPYLVKDPNTIWLGLEYFCNEGDAMWSMSDDAFKKFAISEIAKVGIVQEADVLDTTLVRVKKAYPGYFGTYKDFDVIRAYTDSFANLFLIGRNGMHKYNNQDHSMLTAIEAVSNILEHIPTKENIWNVNAEQDYHEAK